MENICPVCNYNGLFDPPYDKHGRGSDEICPSCGFHFGLDDFNGKEKAFDEWRNQWVRGGCKWFSNFRHAPPDWEPVVLTLDFGGDDEEDNAKENDAEDAEYNKGGDEDVGGAAETYE